MNYKERVGLNINYYRKLADLTLKQVADRVGITEATMQKYEKGLIKRVDIEMIESIAEAIGTTASTLTGWIDNDSQKTVKQIGKDLSSASDFLQESVNKALANNPYLQKVIAAAENTQNYESERESAMKTLMDYSEVLKNYDPSTIDKAMKFLSDYQAASPSVRTAIDALLGDSQ